MKIILSGLMASLALVVSTAAWAEIKTERVSYSDGEVQLEGFLAYDDRVAEKRAGVLLFHEWWGKTEYVESRARQYAELGFVAFALDMYGKGVVVDDAERAKVLSGAFYQDRGLFRRRAARGLEVLASHALVDRERIAALGYCFGGTGVLELARSGAAIRGGIVFHGGLANPNPQDARKIRGKILVLTGAADPFVPAAEVAAFKSEMDKARVSYEVVEYPGAEHAFTNPSVDAKNIPGASYQREADEDSFNRSKAFLARTLR